MYRPTAIQVSKCFWGRYSAYLILCDDGMTEVGGDQLSRGFDLKQGPYGALTYRRAWRKAFKAAGRRLWDLPVQGEQPLTRDELEELAALLISPAAIREFVSEEDWAEYERCRDSVIEARRHAEREGHNIWIG